MKIVFLDAATMGDASMAEIAALGEFTCYPSSTAEEARVRAADADVVLLLRRPCKNPKDQEFLDKTLAYVDVAKHRNGPTGEARLDFQDEFTKFTDRAGERYGDEGQYVPMDTPPV